MPQRVNHTHLHRWLKWVWICPGLPVSFFLRNSVPWLVFMSVYAIIVGHWSAEEAADSAPTEQEQDQGDDGEDQEDRPEHGTAIPD